MFGFSMVGGQTISSSPGHGVVGQSSPPFRVVLGAAAADSGFVGFSTCVLSKFGDPFFRKSNLASVVFCTSDTFGRLDEGVNGGRCLRANAAFGEAGVLIESTWISGMYLARTVPRGPDPSVGKVKGIKADWWVGFNVGDKAPTPRTSRSDDVAP